LHHCDRHDLLYRLGGVCLMPVPAESGTCRSGTAVPRATRNLLLPVWERHSTCRRACQLMNAGPGGVLDRFRFRIQHLAAGHRDQKRGAGR
jgi:hypothetical protein